MKLYTIFGVIFIVFGVAQLYPTETLKSILLSSNQAWGYNEVYENVNMFWWLYFANPSTQYSEFNPYDKPLLIWIGFCPTADTNFNQYGPFTSDLEVRNYSLVNDYNILFIDSIAGAGFSYTENETLYAKTTHTTAYDILMCIKQCLHKFPAFMSTPSYIVADSFFAKIAPELAQLWKDIEIPEKMVSNLKGIIVGNPLVSSLPTKAWARLKTLEDINKTSYLKYDDVVEFSFEKGWLQAYDKIKNMPNSCLNDSCELQLLPDNTEKFIHDHLVTIMEKPKLSYFMNYVVKNCLRLKSYWGLSDSLDFIGNLKNQMMKPVLGQLFEKLLSTTNLTITILNTYLDLKIENSGALNWVEELNWPRKDIWNNVSKIHFEFDHQIKGWKKSYDKLHLYALTGYENPDLKTNSKFLRDVIFQWNKTDSR